MTDVPKIRAKVHSITLDRNPETGEVTMSILVEGGAPIVVPMSRAGAVELAGSLLSIASPRVASMLAGIVAEDIAVRITTELGVQGHNPESCPTCQAEARRRSRPV